MIVMRMERRMDEQWRVLRGESTCVRRNWVVGVGLFMLSMSFLFI